MSTDTANELRNEISDRIREMIFLSESESPLQLLPAGEGAGPDEPDDHDPGIDGAAFLQSIRDSIDPDDEGLNDYVEQWEDLFELLDAHATGVCVYRRGSAPAMIEIVTRTADDTLVIRTEAVET